MKSKTYRAIAVNQPAQVGESAKSRTGGSRVAGLLRRVDTKSKRRASANRQERERDIIYSGELSPLDEALVRQTAHHRRPPGYDEPGSLYGLFTG